MENFKVSFEVKNIHELENSPQNFYAGQVCYDQDNQKLMVYKDSKWIPLNNNAKLNAEGSGIEINLYDLNKNIMSQLKPLSDEKLKELKKLILTFDDTIDNTYYMLLCRERIIIQCSLKVVVLVLMLLMKVLLIVYMIQVKQ